MDFLPIKSPAELIEDIRAKLSGKSPGDTAAYALIVGAGFSYGVVPMTRELLQERIGQYYYYDSFYGGDEQAHRLCRDYWEEFNAAGLHSHQPPVDLDRQGLPLDPEVAYQLLFGYRTANALFASAPAPPLRYIDRLRKSRPVAAPKVLAGEEFVRKFLQEMLDFGDRLTDEGGQTDDNTMGPGKLNGAHRFLAALLKLQQTGELAEQRPFCRTIFTTNFD